MIKNRYYLNFSATSCLATHAPRLSTKNQRFAEDKNEGICKDLLVDGLVTCVLFTNDGLNGRGPGNAPAPAKGTGPGKGARAIKGLGPSNGPVAENGTGPTELAKGNAGDGPAITGGGPADNAAG